MKLHYQQYNFIGLVNQLHSTVVPNLMYSPSNLPDYPSNLPYSPSNSLCSAQRVIDDFIRQPSNKTTNTEHPSLRDIGINTEPEDRGPSVINISVVTVGTNTDVEIEPSVRQNAEQLPEYSVTVSQDTWYPSRTSSNKRPRDRATTTLTQIFHNVNPIVDGRQQHSSEMMYIPSDDPSIFMTSLPLALDFQVKRAGIGESMKKVIVRLDSAPENLRTCHTVMFSTEGGEIVKNREEGPIKIIFHKSDSSSSSNNTFNFRILGVLVPLLSSCTSKSNRV